MSNSVDHVACQLEMGPPSLETCTDRRNSSLAKARQMRSLVDSFVCSLLSAPVYSFLTLPAIHTHTHSKNSNPQSRCCWAWGGLAQRRALPVSGPKPGGPCLAVESCVYGCGCTCWRSPAYTGQLVPIAQMGQGKDPWDTLKPSADLSSL